MESRNIINHLNQVVGQMQMPDGTSEEQWQAILAPYTIAPKQLTIQEIVLNKLAQYEITAEQLIRELKRDNTLAGITVQQSDQMFDDFADVLLRLREGAFPTAVYRLSQKAPSGFVTQQLIDAWVAKIKNYL